MGIVTKLKECAACKRRRERFKQIRALANERIRQVITGVKSSSSRDE